MQESDIQDILIDQLECLEKGLKFLDKEKYVPNKISTKSFIDIVARDGKNNWVIIELKKSDSSSRQAIHEVLKYVEAVKAHLGVRDDEIRTMIVSTVWNELLVPFSRFYSETSLDVTGILLDISDPNNLSSQKVIPLKITAGRTLSPWHELNFYTDEDELMRGVKSYSKANSSKGFDDYILVVLKAPSGHHEKVMAATRESMANVRRQFADEIDYEDIDKQLEKMEEFKYILYFVPQLLSKEACLEALKRAGEDMVQLQEVLEDMEEEEILCTLHEDLFAADPKTYNQRYEIGYPAKFSTRLIDDEGWSFVEIKRYGSLARNTLLTDQTIISEICGETGSSGQKFTRSISIASKSQLSSARAEISECLSLNPVWGANILAHLDEIEKDYPDGEVDISIFNPSTGLFTLFFAVTQEQGELFVPTYCMTVNKNGVAATLFFGELAAGRNKKTFRHVIDRFYNGDIGELLMSASWGYRESRDSELLDYIGIQYASYRCDAVDDDRKFFEWHNSTWRESESIVLFSSLAGFFERETTFMKHLVTKVARRISGGIVDGSCNEKPLRKLIDKSSSGGPQHKASDFAGNCDLCKCAFAEENFLVDAKVPGQGDRRAFLCADCVADTGATIGWGEGQLYQRVEFGGWQRVAGGPPDSDSV